MRLCQSIGCEEWRYQIFEEKARECIPFMSLEGGKRMVTLLLANLKIWGMMCLVLKEKEAAIPYGAPLQIPKRL
ncbi:hypothetical protein A7K72_04425 [Candidatus Methylacidiphilum fumarolicum]|nr:hypothetical protein A7K72_04425 [Candidatus Methylacidiphilum fumarolicum]